MTLTIRKTLFGTALLAGLTTLAGVSLRADVQVQEKTHMQFAGALGRMVNMFGGKTTKEGIVQTVAVKGERMMTVNDKNGELIDLAEEKVYYIDFDSKSYKVITFAELRQKTQDAEEKARKQFADAKEKQDKEKPSAPPKKMAVDVTTKETGQRKTLNGFDCKEVVTVVSTHEDGKTLEESGGMVLTTDAWMTRPIPALKEVAAFRKRYLEKLSGMDAAAMAAQMAQAMAMYPQMGALMGRARVEGTKVEGTAISTVSTFETVSGPEQKKEQADQQQQQDSGGGLGGMLARKMMKKKQQQDNAAAPTDPNRAQIMTTTMEVLSVTSDVSPDAVNVPAGFKQKS